jgi:hypothetical protein
MLPWIHSIRRVHHRSSHKYLRVMTVREEGKGETMATTPDRLVLTVDFGTPSYKFTVNICTYLIF